MSGIGTGVGGLSTTPVLPPTCPRSSKPRVPPHHAVRPLANYLQPGWQGAWSEGVVASPVVRTHPRTPMHALCANLSTPQPHPHTVTRCIPSHACTRACASTHARPCMCTRGASSRIRARALPHTGLPVRVRAEGGGWGQVCVCVFWVHACLVRAHTRSGTPTLPAPTLRHPTPAAPWWA